MEVAIYMATALVWFRQDLRMADNPALCAACECINTCDDSGNKNEIIPLYIYDTSLEEQASLGGASKWWLHHALNDLAARFDNKLIVRAGKPLDVIQSLCKDYDIDAVYWNRMYESWARERDSEIKKTLKSNGIEAKSYNGSLLWEPMDVLKNDGTPYKVFTPYYRKGCLRRASPRYPLPEPKFTLFHTLKSEADSAISRLNLLPNIPWDDTIKNVWQVSENAAKNKLKNFIGSAIQAYTDARNLPAVKGTSQLSPYLHFGQISPHQIWYAVHDAFGGDVSQQGVDTYLSEIGWREFSYYLLYHFPHMPHQNFNAKFNKVTWRNSESDFKAWIRGKTGVPIVDAGMRELWQTGYMHNRVRMIVGSYLVKNLLIDWRRGERWFWDCLLDADTASNAASWQWVAGSGADAAPYFRIFNPILQGEKFDKQGEYVKQFCPELSKLPQKYIHKPWEASDDVLAAAGVTLGKHYPKPLVDLKLSRQRALDAFAAMKEEASD